MSGRKKNPSRLRKAARVAVLALTLAGAGALLIWAIWWPILIIMALAMPVVFTVERHLDVDLSCRDIGILLSVHRRHLLCSRPRLQPWCTGGPDNHVSPFQRAYPDRLEPLIPTHDGSSQFLEAR